MQEDVAQGGVGASDVDDTSKYLVEFSSRELGQLGAMGLKVTSYRQLGQNSCSNQILPLLDQSRPAVHHEHLLKAFKGKRVTVKSTDASQASLVCDEQIVDLAGPQLLLAEEPAIVACFNWYDWLNMLVICSRQSFGHCQLWVLCPADSDKHLNELFSAEQLWVFVFISLFIEVSYFRGQLKLCSYEGFVTFAELALRQEEMHARLDVDASP